MRFRRDLPAVFRAALDQPSAAALFEAAPDRSKVRAFLDRPARVLSIGMAAAHVAAAGAIADKPTIRRGAPTGLGAPDHDLGENDSHRILPGARQPGDNAPGRH